MKLEEVHLVERLEPLQQQMRKQTFDFDNAPYNLRVAANEAFFYLIRNGYIVPQHNAGLGFPEHHPRADTYGLSPLVAFCFLCDWA